MANVPEQVKNTTESLQGTAKDRRESNLVPQSPSLSQQGTQQRDRRGTEERGSRIPPAKMVTD